MITNSPPSAILASPAPESSSARRIEIVNLILVVIGSLACFALGERRELWAFLMGGGLNMANLRLLRAIVGGLTGQKKISRGRLIAQVILKFGGLLGLLAAIMIWVKPAPIPFLLGLSTVVAAIVVEGVIGIFRSPE